MGPWTTDIFFYPMVKTLLSKTSHSKKKNVQIPPQPPLPRYSPSAVVRRSAAGVRRWSFSLSPPLRWRGWGGGGEVRRVEGFGFAAGPRLFGVVTWGWDVGKMAAWFEIVPFFGLMELFWRVLRVACQVIFFFSFRSFSIFGTLFVCLFEFFFSYWCNFFGKCMLFFFAFSFLKLKWERVLTLKLSSLLF